MENSRRFIAVLLSHTRLQLRDWLAISMRLKVSMVRNVKDLVY